jgi:hypothetical protein
VVHNIVIHNTEKGVQFDGHAYEDWKKLKHFVSRQRSIGRALPVPSIGTILFARISFCFVLFDDFVRSYFVLFCFVLTILFASISFCFVLF